MSTLSSHPPFVPADDDQSPSFDEQNFNSFPPVMTQSDHAELDAWLTRKEVPMSDAELDQLWAEEMIRRDAERERADQAAAELAALAQSTKKPSLLRRIRTAGIRISRDGDFFWLVIHGIEVCFYRSRRNALKLAVKLANAAAA